MLAERGRPRRKASLVREAHDTAGEAAALPREPRTMSPQDNAPCSLSERAGTSNAQRLKISALISFLRTSPRDFRRKNKRKKTLNKSCRRFWRWSSRESAWPISKLILAMGGTLGPAPKAMQLSRPSLLSYLQRFNKKRRVHYKIDAQPRLRSDAPSPRIREPVKIPSRAAR